MITLESLSNPITKELVMTLTKSCSIFFILSLFITWNAYAADTINICTSPTLLDRKVKEIIIQKITGNNPNFNNQTSNISNLELRKKRIVELKSEFDSIKADGCYITEPIPIVLVSDAMKGKLSVTQLIRIPRQGQVLAPFDNVSENISFDNASEFNQFNIDTLKKESPLFEDLAANSKQVPGFIIVTFKNTRLFDRSLSLPTVMPYKGSSFSSSNFTKCEASAVNVKFLFENKRQIFERKFNVTETQTQDQNDSGQKLANSDNPKDFDIRGINVSMSPDDVRKLAKKNSWFIDDDNIRGNLKLCSHDCNLPVDKRPSGYFSMNVYYDTKNKGRIHEISSDSDYNLSREEMKKLILDKYGMPLFRDPGDGSIYYYGKDLSQGKGLSRQYVFYVHLTEYSSPTDRGDTFGLILRLSNPQTDDTILAPVKPSI